MKKSKPLVGYIRISKEEKKTGGCSLARQRDAIERYCAERGLHLIDVLADDGVSGGLPADERPGLRAALAIMTHAGSGLIVSTVDRLSRNAGDHANMLTRYFSRRAKYALHCADEPTYAASLHTSAGETVALIHGALAQGERTRISERVSNALGYLRKQGWYVGGLVPYGSTLMVEGRGELRPRARRIVPDAADTLVARARALRSSGLTYRAIGLALEREGYQPRKARVFSAKVIWSMCRAESVSCG